MFSSLKITIFSLEEERKKEEYSIALEEEETGPTHPKVEFVQVKEINT